MEPTGSYAIAHVATRAARYLRRLPRPQQEAVAEAFDHLCEVSPLRHPNPTVIRRLKGEYRGFLRYRLGALRIIYSVDQEERTISIVAIDQRGDVY